MREVSPPIRRHSHRMFFDSFRCIFARIARDRSGVAAVEFSIIVPLMTLMVIAIADIGFAVYRKTQVEDAAQAGVEWAIKYGFDSSAISNAVTSASNASIIASPAPAQFCGCATASSISAVACGTPCPDGTLAGTYATVSAQLTYNTTLNYGVVPVTYVFGSQSTARLQ